MLTVECLNCGLEYPPTHCRWRCPMCGFKDSCCDGEPQHVRYPKNNLERFPKGRKHRPSEEDFYVD